MLRITIEFRALNKLSECQFQKKFHNITFLNIFEMVCFGEFLLILHTYKKFKNKNNEIA